MPFPGEHSVRLRNPAKYKKFRRQNDKMGTGVDAIFGITAAGKAELQAVRFDKSKHSIEDVRSWVKKHDYHPISITPAKSADHSAPAASAVAVRGAVQNVSQAFKPDVQVGTTSQPMPITKTVDGKSDLHEVDAPYLQDKTFPKPSDDAKSEKYGDDKKLLDDLAEARDLNGVRMGPASDPIKDTGAVTGKEIMRRAVPLMYDENDSCDADPDDLPYLEMAKTLAPAGMDVNELAMGIEHELEHTDDPMKSAQYAIDHLIEIKDYYTRLGEMEDTADHAAPADHAEINMGITSEPAVGLGIHEDRQALDSPQSTLKQDATAEAVQDRDKPVYNEEDADDPDDDEDDPNSMWVEAFRAGQYTDSDGITRKWDPGDLSRIAQQYNSQSKPTNPNRKVAPVVLGHPSSDAPAYGWIDHVKAIGDVLKAKLTDLNPKFVEALKTGAYKTRSISLYPDLNIRHIGFLGAVQPAVPGLGPFKFASNEKAITYEYAEPEVSMDDIKALKKENQFFKKLFQLFKVDVTKAAEFAEGGDKALEAANAAAGEPNAAVAANLTAPDENALQQRVPASRGVDPNYKGEATMGEKAIINPGENEKSVKVDALRDDKDAMTKLEKEIAELKTECQRLKQENESMAKELGGKEVRERTMQHREFCEQLVTDGRLRPADVEQHVLNMELRYKQDASTSDFAEKKETPTLDNYKEYLAYMPRIVCFEELAMDPKPVTASNLGEESMSAGKKIMKYCDDYMKKNPGASYGMALSAAEAEMPKDMQEYMAKEAFCDK